MNVQKNLFDTIFRFALSYKIRNIIKSWKIRLLRFNNSPSQPCLEFPSRSALSLVWLRQYSLRASLPGFHRVGNGMAYFSLKTTCHAEAPDICVRFNTSPTQAEQQLISTLTTKKKHPLGRC